MNLYTPGPVSSRLKATSVGMLSSVAVFVTLVWVISGFLIYNNQSRAIRQRKMDELNSIAELKIQQIVQWRQERMTDASMDSASLFFNQALEQWLAAPDDASLKTALLTRLQSIANLEGYQNVILTSTDGHVLLSLDKNVSTLEDESLRLAVQASHSTAPILGDFFQQSATRQIYLDVAAPIFKNDPANKVQAVLILRSDPQKYLYPLIQSWPTPSQSAETLLVRKEGENVVFLNTLRHDSAPPLSLRISLTSTEVPAVQAVIGKTGEIEGIDYRQVKVLAEIIPVPGTPWFMIAKVDTSEILAEIGTLGLVALLIVVLAIMMTILLAASFFNNRQSKLFQNLFQAEKLHTQAQEEIRTTLYSIGDGVITTDEKGCVTRVNPVAETLTGWTETQAKGKPLTQIFQIINEISRSEVENPVDRVLREGIIVGLANHTLLIARDGTERPIADSGAPIYNQPGHVSGVVLVFRDQTQERSAQKERALLNHTIATSLNEIYLFDAKTLCFRFANAGALKNIGYSMEQMQQMTPPDITPEFTLQTFQEAIEPLFKHEQSVLVFETVHQRADGSRYPVEEHLQLFEYEGEQVFLAVINDITTRKQNEDALQENEARLLRAQSAAHIGNWELDLGDRKMWASEEAFRIYGLERTSPYLSLELAQFIPLAEDRPRLDAELQNLIQGKGRYDIEYRLRSTSDGTERVIHSVAQLGQNDHGAPAKVYGTIQDITELRYAEQSLIESEQRYRSLFQNDHTAMLLIDPENNRIVDANPAASEFYGWSVEELTQMNINQINTLSSEDVGHEIESARSMQRKSFLLQHIKKNGQICDVEVFSGPIKLKGKTLIYSIVHDITDRKQVETKVTEQLEELRRWYQVTLGREDRVRELKQEVNELLEQSGLPPRYVVTSRENTL
jgi:PAS domain S-box-containing protein